MGCVSRLISSDVQRSGPRVSGARAGYLLQAWLWWLRSFQRVHQVPPLLPCQMWPVRGSGWSARCHRLRSESYPWPPLCPPGLGRSSLFLRRRTMPTATRWTAASVSRHEVRRDRQCRTRDGAPVRPSHVLGRFRLHRGL